MNQRSILIGLLFAAALSPHVYGQKTKTKTIHPLVDTIFNRNELSINMAPVISILTGAETVPQSFILSIGYSRNFGRNHYLRAGVKVMPISILQSGDDPKANTFYNSDVYFEGKSLQLQSFTDNAVIAHSSFYKIKTSFYIGYEHLFGNSRTRLLLGMDLHAGFNYFNTIDHVETYATTYNLDSISGNYLANVTGTSTFQQQISATNFHWGLSPRIGIRFEVSKKVALTAVACPMLYMEINNYNYSASTHRYVQSNTIFTLVDVQPMIAEIGINIKM